jgi:ADP-ribosyl-[dinitrogen reductase] hydrolase
LQCAPRNGIDLTNYGVTMDAVALDRAIGLLVGLAVGDALGTTLEFQQRDRIPEHRDMTGGGPFRLEPGQWTDDTATAVALADSLTRRQQFDAADFANNLVSWWRNGEFSCTGTCFDIGVTTREALAAFERTGEPMSGSTEESTAGNGSIMRLAPAVLFELHDKDAMLRLAADQGRVTHGAPQAVDACRVLADTLRATILGMDDTTVSHRSRVHPELTGLSTAPISTKPGCRSCRQAMWSIRWKLRFGRSQRRQRSRTH